MRYWISVKYGKRARVFDHYLDSMGDTVEREFGIRINLLRGDKPTWIFLGFSIEYYSKKPADYWENPDC